MYFVALEGSSNGSTWAVSGEAGHRFHLLIMPPIFQYDARNQKKRKEWEQLWRERGHE